MEINIKNIQQQFVDGEFDSYKVTYDVLINGRKNKTVKRYIDEEMDYDGIVNYIFEKEENIPIRELHESMSIEEEIEEEEELITEEEEF